MQCSKRENNTKEFPHGLSKIDKCVSTPRPQRNFIKLHKNTIKCISPRLMTAYTLEKTNEFLSHFPEKCKNTIF